MTSRRTRAFARWTSARRAPTATIAVATIALATITTTTTIEPDGVHALDRATAMIGARDAWARGSTRGAGVIVGIVDSGIDPAHEDFIEADGRSRIAWWLAIGDAPRGAHVELESIGEGAVWSASDLDDARSRGADADLPRDLDGHGTAVAAAAVGDGGSDRDPGVLAGVAPEATIVAVRALRPGMSGLRAEDVWVGARFVFEIAERASMPAVVVIPSASPRDEPIDDGTPLSVALESLARARPGRVIVAAAGNLGDPDHHRSATLARDRDLAFELSVPASDDTGATSGVELLLRLAPRAGTEGIDGTFARPTLAIESPGGEHVALGTLDLGGATDVDPSLDCGRYEPIDCLPDGRAPDVAHVIAEGSEIRLFAPRGTDPDGARWWTLSILGGGSDARGPLVHGRYALSLRGGDGRIDVIVIRAEQQGAWRSPYLVDGVDSRAESTLLGYPGAADGIVSVGAVTSRETASMAADLLDSPLPWPPMRADFSSAGPTFDARAEPDVVAPGRFVVTALAAGSTYATASVYATYRNGTHIVIAGTSMAAPLVGGALALVLARHPALSSDALGAIVRATARGSAGASSGSGTPSAAYDPELGAGLVDVPAGLVLADAIDARSPAGAPADATASAAALTRASLGAADLETRVVVRPRDAAGRPVHADIAIAASHGAIGAIETDATGRAVVPITFAAGGRRPSRVRIVASVDGLALAPLHLEVESGEPRGVAGGGGCAVARIAPARPGGTGSDTVVSVCGGLVLLAAARRGRPRVARGPNGPSRARTWPTATRSPPPSV